MNLLQQVREDISVNEGDILSPGLHALIVHRIGAWRSRLPTPARQILYPAYIALYVFVRNIYGIELPWRTKVGRRVKLAHQSGIVIHPCAVIGDDCLIRHNVTIGAASARGDWRNAPHLGRGVELGPGVVIIGKVHIGDGARIAPNVVITSNIPAGAMVVAAPARIIPPPKGTQAQNEKPRRASTVG